MAKELQIERSDINGAIAVNKGLTRDIILFDDVPGGAGLVRKLMDEKSLVNVLKASYEVVKIRFKECFIVCEKQLVFCHV